MNIRAIIAKNTVFNFIGNGADVLSTFVVGIALARTFGPEVYGRYNFLMWMLTFAFLFANLGLGLVAKRFIAEAIGRQNPADARGIVQLVLRIRIISVLVICAVMMALSGLFSRIFVDGGNSINYVLLALNLIPYSVNMVMFNIFAGFQRYEYGAYVMVGGNLLRVVLLVTLGVLGFGITEVLEANLLAWAIGMLLALFLLRNITPLRSLLAPSPLAQDTQKSALTYALTCTGILVVSYLLWSQAEVLLMGLWCSPEEVGFYRIANQLPVMLMLLVPMVFGGVLLPVISEQFGRGDTEKIKIIYLHSSRYLMMLSLPLAAGSIALARPIVTGIWGHNYAPAILMMQIIFIPFASRGIAESASAVLQALNKVSIMLKVGLVIAILMVGLNVWLIPQYGALGAAIGSAIPRLFFLPLVIHFASREIKGTWPILDTIKITLASAIMGLVLFAIQANLGTVPCLLVALPVGLVILVTALLVFRAVKPEDLRLLKLGQRFMPSFLRKRYDMLIHLVERVVS